MDLHDYVVKRPYQDDISPEETLADSSSSHSIVEIPISRGVLRIFYGTLAVIMAVLAVQAFRLQIVQGEHLSALADQSRYNTYPIPALRGIIFDAKKRPLVENVPVFDLVAVTSELLPEDPLRNRSNDQAVFVVERDIPKKDAIQFQASPHQGLYVVPYAKRQYLGGAAFAHVLGYTSQITQDELKSDVAHKYRLNDRIGRLGLESYYEAELHGEPQSVILDSGAGFQEATGLSGKDIATTLDMDVQEHLYKSVESIFRASGVRRGAAVIQNVKTGAVLGMVSMPSFDPNLFEESPNEATNSRLRLILNDFNKPLFNRAISGLYASGSTIKPLYALAGLKEKNVTPSTVIYAGGSIQVQSEVDPNSYYTFKDWKVHGWTDIRKAIADSVDVYFYALGGGYGDIRGLGIDVLERYLRSFRIDKITEIDLPNEVAGFVPSKQWKKEKKGEPWYIGDTYNLSIGQGDLAVTPIWLTVYASAIANGGKLMKPYLVNREPEVLGTVDFDDKTWKVVHEGMRQTVTDGTARSLNDLPKAVAAKTGTAQVTGSGLNSLFIVYGPYENPEIAMTILIEQIPESQSLAVRVAKDFLSWYFLNQ